MSENLAVARLWPRSLDELLEAGKEAEQRAAWDDALTVYGTALELLGTEPSGSHADVLRRMGGVHYYRGDLDRAAEQLAESCAVAEAAGAVRPLASGLNFRATVLQGMGELEEAERLYTAALALAEEAGHPRLAVMINQNLGTLANIMGDAETALERYEAALAQYVESGDGEGELWATNNLGMVRTRIGDFAAAEADYQRALRLAEQRRDSEMLGTVQLNRADLFLRQERFDDARSCADQAFELFGMLGSKYGIGESYKLYGMLFRGAGKLHLAEAHLASVVEIAERGNYKLLEAEALAELALICQERAQNEEALEALNRAHRLFSELGAERELLDIDLRLDGLEESYLAVISAWGESIESKDSYTAGHSSRVADLTRRLAEADGYTGRELTWIHMGAFLHDVGKVAVDVEVLQKKEKLTEAEWEQIKGHTTAGDEIVAGLSFPYDIRPIVRSHHEHWDGGGYPDGLAGEAIPRIARILTIADVYDALTTTRSYRPAFSHEDAMKIMESEAGRVLDPELFRSFAGLLEEESGRSELTAPLH